ncbi:hypothetical protein Q8F55_002975 [Vanrija albida]|uniref:F-box domain-containing protein n=1 Tax=Vanrija albida TaxID=181172 RepID=A0ABR3QBG2_9TREE
MPSPSTTTALDYDAYPHIFETVASYAEHATLLQLRLTCRRAHADISSLLFSHLYVFDADAAGHRLAVRSAYTKGFIGVRGAVVERMNALLRYARTLTIASPLKSFDFSVTTSTLDTILLAPELGPGSVDQRAPTTLPGASTFIGFTDVNTLAPYLEPGLRSVAPLVMNFNTGLRLPTGVRRFVLHVRFNEEFQWRDNSYMSAPKVDGVQDVTVILSRAERMEPPPTAPDGQPQPQPHQRPTDRRAADWLPDMVSKLVELLWAEGLASKGPRKLTIVGFEDAHAAWCGVAPKGTSLATALRADVAERVYKWLLQEQEQANESEGGRRMTQALMEGRVALGDVWSGTSESTEQWEKHRLVVLQSVAHIKLVKRDVYRRSVGPRQWALEMGE